MSWTLDPVATENACADAAAVPAALRLVFRHEHLDAPAVHQDRNRAHQEHQAHAAAALDAARKRAAGCGGDKSAAAAQVQTRKSELYADLSRATEPAVRELAALLAEEQAYRSL